MHYHTKAFAKLTGVTVRTLRYYHQIGLLVPAVAANGYREYSSADADRLQAILLYRQLGLPLAELPALLAAPSAERHARLTRQRAALVSQQTELARTLAQLDATLANQKGVPMTDTEKFTAFKQARLKQNDADYGAEVTAKYGAAAKTAADHHYAGLTEAQMAAMTAAEARLKTALTAYLAQPQLPGPDAAAAYHAHRDWLAQAVPNYTPALHRGIVQLYRDPRFATYYERLVGDPGAAAALIAIVTAYLPE